MRKVSPHRLRLAPGYTRMPARAGFVWWRSNGLVHARPRAFLGLSSLSRRGDDPFSRVAEFWRVRI